jgi:hypothetical protein
MQRCIPWRHPFSGHFITLELEQGPVSRDHWILEYLIDGECREHHPTLLYTRALRGRWPLTPKISLWWEMATPFHFTKAWGGSTWPRLVWVDEKTTGVHAILHVMTWIMFHDLFVSSPPPRGGAWSNTKSKHNEHFQNLATLDLWYLVA